MEDNSEENLLVLATEALRDLILVQNLASKETIVDILVKNLSDRYGVSQHDLVYAFYLQNKKTPVEFFRSNKLKIIQETNSRTNMKSDIKLDAAVYYLKSKLDHGISASFVSLFIKEAIDHYGFEEHLIRRKFYDKYDCTPEKYIKDKIDKRNANINNTTNHEYSVPRRTYKFEEETSKPTYQSPSEKAWTKLKSMAEYAKSLPPNAKIKKWNMLSL